MDGWNTSEVSFWKTPYFQGRTVSFFGVYPIFGQAKQKEKSSTLKKSAAKQR